MRRASVLPLLLVAGCAGVQAPLAPAGEQARALSWLFWLMLGVCALFYLAVLAGIGWAIARRRKDADGEGALHRSLWAWGAAIVVGLTVLIVASFFADRAVFAHRGREALTVRVTGQQYWWRIQYLDRASGRWIETANELHLPLGRTTRVIVGSADVIHSFWVPNVAGKLDTIPGRRNVLDLTPTRAGWFRGQCAEFCGAQHAHMALDVKVEGPAALAAWLAAQARPAVPPGDAMAARGAALVEQGACGACHVVRGTGAAGRPGPDLTHVASRRSLAAGTLPMSRGNLQGWIVQPQAIKPGVNMPAVTLAPADANAIAHYLEMLR